MKATITFVLRDQDRRELQTWNCDIEANTALQLLDKIAAIQAVITSTEGAEVNFNHEKRLV